MTSCGACGRVKGGVFFQLSEKKFHQWRLIVDVGERLGEVEAARFNGGAQTVQADLNHRRSVENSRQAGFAVSRIEPVVHITKL